MFKKKIENEYFEIKPISLIDCLEDRDFLPFSLIEKQSTNAYQNMMAEMRENNPYDAKYIEYMDKYISRYVFLGKTKIPKEIIELMDIKEKVWLFSLIIEKSFKLFKKIIKIPKKTAINLHSLAKEYHLLPIEFIANKDEYNKLDAYIFNYYCLACGRELEAAQIKRANIEAKRRKK